MITLVNLILHVLMMAFSVSLLIKFLSIKNGRLSQLLIGLFAVLAWGGFCDVTQYLFYVNGTTLLPWQYLRFVTNIPEAALLGLLVRYMYYDHES